MIEKFGPNSNTYLSSVELIKKAWKKASYETQKNFSIWKDIQIGLYGESQAQRFFENTYLIWIMRTIRSEIFGVQIKKSLKDNIYSWIWNTPNIASKFIDILKNSIKTLNLDDIEKDIFKDLYEIFINKDIRIRRGEYNTPDWLAELMLGKILVKENNSKSLKIIDPACGTGTFIFHAIRQTHSSSIIGIDINQLSVEIAKTNYLIALGRNQQIYEYDSDIPIYCFDTLKLSSNEIEMLGKFDVIIGNPPWGSLRDIKNPEYQSFIKRRAINKGLIDGRDTHLFSQIEISTVFFIKCLELLNENGILAFVMPRSVISFTMQNLRFMQAQNLGFHLIEILDLRNVKPLFNMPTCVLISKKNGINTYPVNLMKYNATFPIRGYSLIKAREFLTFEKSNYNPIPYKLNRSSYYYKLFKSGLSIFPRSFYFIDPIKIHGEIVEVQTSEKILKSNTKEPWKIQLKGHIETEYIYSTLLGQEIMPYYYKRLRPVVLPIKKRNAKFVLLNIDNMYEENKLGLANWFEKVQKIWCERRTPKSITLFPTIFDRLNYGNLLKRQSPKYRFIVSYNATGKNLFACIIDRQNIPIITINNTVLKPIDLISNVKTWIYETNNYNEALYLCGILNSEIMNKTIKPLQPQGLGGPRAIHRRPLMFNIPKFNESISIHHELSRLTSLHIGMLSELNLTGSRSRMKKLFPYNDEIDILVSELLFEKIQ